MDTETDSDAGVPSSVGVGKVDQTPKAIHLVNPNWVEDGYGIVGPQRQVTVPFSARPNKIEFQIDNTSRPHGGLGGGKITVTTEDVSAYIPGSGIPEVDNVDTLTFDQDMFEIFDGGGGQCIVRLKVCDATCGAGGSVDGGSP